MTNVFVWTVGDVVGLAVLAVVGVMFAIVWIAGRVDEWRYRRARKSNR